MAKKYRYFMSGMFEPTDGEMYEINIPSPHVYDSEKEALQDDGLGYRFILLDEETGPIIVIYENEKFKLNEDKKSLNVWVTGNVIASYTFDEFTATNGYMRVLKPERNREKVNNGFIHIDGSTDFLTTSKTFKDIFPNMEKQKLYYIDSEAYYIEEKEEK